MTEAVDLSDALPDREARDESDSDGDAVADALAADDALDALQAAVWARLMANATLSGTVADIEPTGIEWDYAAEATGMGCATLTFTVKHSTQPDSLE